MNFGSYSHNGTDELLLSSGPENAAIRVCIAPPLFDELNRLRRTLALMMRTLGDHDIASFLPDLPGQNESMRALVDISIADWQTAFQAAASAAGATHIISLRGGALIDGAAGLPVWRHAPSNGKKLLTTMLRAQIAADKESGIERKREDYLAMAESAPVMLGGKLFSGYLMRELMAAGQAQAAHISEDKGPFGPPLWLRAEPGESAEMADKMANAVASWAKGAAG